MRLLEKWLRALGFCCFVVSERWIFVYNEYYPPQRSDGRFRRVYKVNYFLLRLLCSCLYCDGVMLSDFLNTFDMAEESVKPVWAAISTRVISGL